MKPGEFQVHSIWTFHTPFIGGLCNCDPRSCLALNFTVRGLPLYLPGEETAVVDEESCSGCGACSEICIFDAVTAAEDGTAVFDSVKCQGCGICRRVCETDAIAPAPRPQRPGLENRLPRRQGSRRPGTGFVAKFSRGGEPGIDNGLPDSEILSIPVSLPFAGGEVDDEGQGPFAGDPSRHYFILPCRSGTRGRPSRNGG